MKIEELSIKDVKITPEEIEAVIVDIEIRTALEVYGNNVNDPEQKIIVLHLQNKDLGINSQEAIPHYEKENLTDNTTLGKFLLKYESLKVGIIVELRKNEKGYYKVRYYG